jgi:hypothetical protein
MNNFTPTMTHRDCYAAARNQTQLIVSQRKVNRLLKRIDEKEKYAALYQSRFMCERYDEEIEALYAQVAELQGYAMANELDLEQIEAKRREDEAQRIVRLLHLTGPTLEPAAAPSPLAPTAPRTEQLSMFGPGPAPIDTKPLGQLSAADREHAVENDIALGMEMAFERPEPKAESGLAVMAPASSPAVTSKPMFAYSFPPTTAAPESKGPVSQSPATLSPVASPVVPSEVAASQVRQSQPVTKSPETVPDTRPLTTTEDKGSSTDHTD